MDATPDPTPFTLIGGQPAVDRLVDLFYDRMDQLPEARELRAMHAADLAPMRRLLKHYFGEWLGGPRLYSAERGHPRLRARHLPFPIDGAARDAWMLCMDGALATVVTDAALREDLRGAIARLADFMRNREEG